MAATDTTKGAAAARASDRRPVSRGDGARPRLSPPVQAVSRMRGRDTHLAGSEISHAQFELMIELDERGELSAGELALAARLSPASVTQMLDALAESGHVERVRSDSDRRVVLARLTAVGQARVSGQAGGVARALGERPRRCLAAGDARRDEGHAAPRRRLRGGARRGRRRGRPRRWSGCPLRKRRRQPRDARNPRRDGQEGHLKGESLCYSRRGATGDGGRSSGRTRESFLKMETSSR